MLSLRPTPAALGRLGGLVVLFSVACLVLATVAAATDDAGTAYLEKKSAEADVVTLPSGLRYKVMVKGAGSFHPAVDSPCHCRTAGTLIDGTSFDDVTARPIAPDQAMGGWKEALQLMVEGDKWELYLPSELATRDRPPNIPGDAALVFTIELIKITGMRQPWKCHVATLEDCDDRMRAYITTSQADFGGDPDELEIEITRLFKMSGEGDMDEGLQVWINIRVFLLQQMMVGSGPALSLSGDEL